MKSQIQAQTAFNLPDEPEDFVSEPFSPIYFHAYQKNRVPYKHGMSHARVCHLGQLDHWIDVVREANPDLVLMTQVCGVDETRRTHKAGFQVVTSNLAKHHSCVKVQSPGLQGKLDDALDDAGVSVKFKKSGEGWTKDVRENVMFIVVLNQTEATLINWAFDTTGICCVNQRLVGNMDNAQGFILFIFHRKQKDGSLKQIPLSALDEFTRSSIPTVWDEVYAKRWANDDRALFVNCGKRSEGGGSNKVERFIYNFWPEPYRSNAWKKIDQAKQEYREIQEAVIAQSKELPYSKADIDLSKLSRASKKKSGNK